MKYILYLYAYRLHNTFYLEIFDRVPSLSLSPLQARAIHLKHYNRREYREQQFSTLTDIDSATDTEGVLGMDWMTDSSMSRSSSSASFAQIGSLSVRAVDSAMFPDSAGSEGSTSIATNAISTGSNVRGLTDGGNGKQQAHDHHFFAMQVQTDEQTKYGKHSPAGLQSSHHGVLSYENAYANPFNVQVVVDLPAVSCSLYNVVSGCYKEVLHVYLNGIRCVVQRGGCELFSRLSIYCYYCYYC